MHAQPNTVGHPSVTAPEYVTFEYVITLRARKDDFVQNDDAFLDHTASETTNGLINTVQDELLGLFEYGIEVAGRGRVVR